MKNEIDPIDPLEEELEITLTKLSARESDSDKYAKPWLDLGKELADNPDFQAPTASRHFAKSVHKEIKRQRRLNFKKGMKKHRVLVMAAVFVLFAVPVTVLAVNKETVFNFVISVYDEYTTVRNKGEYEMYELDYLPSGYKLMEQSSNGSIYTTSYANAEGDKLTLWQYNGSATVQLDTEEAQLVKPIKLADMEALLVEKDGFCKLIWNTTPQFVVIGKLDTEEIIKMAESIKRK